MTASQDKSIGVSVGFVVRIDDQSLGSFNSCDGLGCEVVMEQREEGGRNEGVWQLPTRLKYSNVKLSRPLTADSVKVVKWVSSVVNGGQTGPMTATIEARLFDGELIASWELQDVLPVRWTGPSFNHDSAKVATETLELAHQGFFKPGT
jgi:phage tail-like protein